MMMHKTGKPAAALLLGSLLFGCVDLDSARTPADRDAGAPVEDGAFAWIRMTTHGMT